MIRQIAIASALVSGTAFAGAFDAADALFADRSQGEAKISEARKLYKDLAESTSGDDKLYAVSQMARLDYTLGEIILPKEAKKQRRKLFDKCLDDVEMISPANFGSETEEYYTWKITCFTFWAESASLVQRLARVGSLKKIIAKALPLTSNSSGVYVGTLEGGAIGRYVSAVWGSRDARAVGLFKPAEARKLIDETLATDYREDRAFPEALSAAEYFENHYISAANYEHNEDKASGIAVLEEAIEELQDMIDSDELPAGREFETKHQLKRMTKKLAELQG